MFVFNCTTSFIAYKNIQSLSQLNFWPIPEIKSATLIDSDHFLMNGRNLFKIGSSVTESTIRSYGKILSQAKLPNENTVMIGSDYRLVCNLSPYHMTIMTDHDSLLIFEVSNLNYSSIF
jgi:hypothetical protein